MSRRWIRFLAVVSAVAAIAGLATAVLAEPSGRTTIRQATTPTARALPLACFVAVGTCSIHPCVEFVAPRPPVAEPESHLQARMVCDMYPSPTEQPVLTRR